MQKFEEETAETLPQNPLKDAMIAFAKIHEMSQYIKKSLNNIVERKKVSEEVIAILRSVLQTLGSIIDISRQELWNLRNSDHIESTTDLGTILLIYSNLQRLFDLSDEAIRHTLGCMSYKRYDSNHVLKILEIINSINELSYTNSSQETL